MTDTAHNPDHPASSQLDDEPIEYVPHRQQIAAAGRLARAEQERLEKETGLQDGRTPKRDPGGIFRNERHGPSHLSPHRVRTPLGFLFFLGIFHPAPARRRLAHELGRVLIKSQIGDSDLINVCIGPLCGLKSDISIGSPTPSRPISLRPAKFANARGGKLS
jgi:hypothetical protein